MPDAVAFQPKWQIALDQIRALQAAGLAPAPVVADAGYGDTTAFREALTAAGLAYIVGVKGETTAWPPGTGPLPPKRWAGRGRPPTRVRRTPRHAPQSHQRLAAALPATAWRTLTWREGSRGAMRSRFARLRVRPAHRDVNRTAPRPEEWLLIEWPRGEPAPTKYWLSTLPETVAFVDLIRLAKLRWRIERDYQELKDELGLDHFEGRAGAASITMAPYASRPMPSSPPSARGFPPRSLWPSSAPLPFPKVSSRGALPVRPERHVPTSITTAYALLARSLLASTPCQWCGHEPRTG